MQQYFSYIVVVSFIGGGNRSVLEKTTDLLQVTEKLYYIMLYISPWSGFELTTSMVIGTDCKEHIFYTIHFLLNVTMFSTWWNWEYLILKICCQTSECPYLSIQVSHYYHKFVGRVDPTHMLIILLLHFYEGKEIK